jgi:hypothetical protein
MGKKSGDKFLLPGYNIQGIGFGDTAKFAQLFFFFEKLLHHLFRIRSNGPQIPGG